MIPTSRSVPQGTWGALTGVTTVSAVLLVLGLVWPQIQNALVLGYAVCTGAAYVAVGLLRAGARRSARARRAAGTARRPRSATPAPAQQEQSKGQSVAAVAAVGAGARVAVGSGTRWPT